MTVEETQTQPKRKKNIVTNVQSEEKDLEGQGRNHRVAMEVGTRLLGFGLVISGKRQSQASVPSG